MTRFIFCTVIFILTNISSNAQPKYTPKHFVAVLDTSEFKITMNKKTGGKGCTYIQTAISIFDVDDDDTTAVRFDQEAVLKIEGTMVNGKRNGIFSTYLMDSADHKKLYKIYDQSYKNDSLDGQWRVYNLKGTLVHSENSVNGKKIGVERDYWIDGTTIINETEYFEDTAKKIERTYYPNGHLKSEFSFINNIPNGICKKYYDTGVLQDQVNFTNGKFNGIRTYYYPNGKEWIVTEYKNDKAWTILANYNSKGNKRDGGTLKNGNGTLLLYDDDTTVREVITYKNGDVQK
jgi:antitoxin component YwqK of YwqJK toxin-antitoxin module